MELNYCRRCGAELKKKTGNAYACANGHTLFPNPAPTVGVFLFDTDGKVIMSVRGIEPNKGRLDSIGGFVDDGETFEQALEREVREETGLVPDDYSTPMYLTSAPSGYEYDGEVRSVLSCFFTATLREGAEPVASDDVASFVHLRPQDIDPDDVGDAQDVRSAIGKLLESNP